jgi:hypothetical protein
VNVVAAVAKGYVKGGHALRLQRSARVGKAWRTEFTAVADSRCPRVVENKHGRAHPCAVKAA